MAASDSVKHLSLSPQGAPQWASLPQDLLQLIGWRVLAGDLLDYVSFRAVCTHWNSSTARPRGRGLVDRRFHPRQWMMLPEGHSFYPGHPDLGGYVRFFSRSTGALVRVHLPLFDDHVILDSIDGLLLLLMHRERGTDIRLLHPFTGDIAEFPPLLSLLPQMVTQAPHRVHMGQESKLDKLSVFLLRGVCATVNISATGAITVMLALDAWRRVAHATAGDQRWTLSSWERPFLSLTPSSVSFKGKLYMLSPSSSPNTNIVDVYQIDPPEPHSPLLPPRKIAECPLVADIGRVNLAECGSDLILIGFNYGNNTGQLVVYRLADLIAGRDVPVTNIGEHTLFLGERGVCVSISTKGLPSFFGNSIICIHKFMIRRPLVRMPVLRRIEQYHLGSGTWSLAIDEDIPCQDRFPANPNSLIQHIFTCCYRSYWNKGLMVHQATIPDWSVKSNLWEGV